MKKIIIISKGKKHICLIDDEDYDLIKKYPWSLNGDGKKGYAQSHIAGKTIFMHRLILGILNNPEVETDHINRCRLDNRRFNLRKCTHSENRKNTNSWGKSKYLGVSIVNYIKRYYDKVYHYTDIRAAIRINGKQKHLGCFKTEIEAAKIYDEQAKIHHKEFANLNFK